MDLAEDGHFGACGILARAADEGHSVHHMIEVAAYYRAQRRSFAQGHELEDWLEAEKGIHHGLQEPKVNAARF